MRGGNFINWELLERADYSKPGIVKGLLFNYDGLMHLARKGDSMAHIVCIDLKRAIHAEKVLTFKQRRYLGLWWQGFSYVDIAAEYHIKPQSVFDVVEAAIKNICKYLMCIPDISPTSRIVTIEEGITFG